MRDVKLKPGMLLLERKYNVIKKLVCKLLKKELPYNQMTIALGDIIHDNNGTFYMPKKEYSKVEICKLGVLLEDASLSTVEIINLIRPKTITNPSKFKINDITNNKYYRLVGNEETKHISTII